MKSTTIRIDDTLKNQCEDILGDLGLTLTTYINTSLRALVREQGIPFKLTTNQRKSAEYFAKLDKSIAQAERGEVVAYTMDELKNLIDEG